MLSLIYFSFRASPRRIRPGPELDYQLAIEGGGDAREGVDPRRPRPALDSGDRRLGGPAQLGQFALGDSPGVSPLRDAGGDQAEQLSVVRI
ncbi:MAG TPA: hypothetical protein VFN92_10015 [Solirubrobacterales bacterium]|nr:hypothetical protein [Solirubrobacterales bacterium]